MRLTLEGLLSPRGGTDGAGNALPQDLGLKGVPLAKAPKGGVLHCDVPEADRWPEWKLGCLGPASGSPMSPTPECDQ